MSTENTTNELWAAVGREVSQGASSRPEVPYKEVTPPRPEIDRLLLAWSSGYLPVVLLCLAWTAMLFGSKGLFSGRALLMSVWGVVLSWVVYPTLWNGGVLRPLRLIPLGLALIWSMPVSHLMPCMVGASDPFNALVQMGANLFQATHQMTLAMMFPLWLALAVVIRRMQQRFPWYDPIPPRRIRRELAYFVLLLPVVANLGAALRLHWSVPAAINEWETRVLDRHGRLGWNGGSNSPWGNLRGKARELSSVASNQQQVRELETAALELLDRQPPGAGDGWNSETVFETLLRRGQDLKSPTICQIGLLECQLSSLSHFDVKPFDRSMRAFLESDEVSKEELETMARRMRKLALVCPSSVDELDYRLYRKRFWERDSLLEWGHIFGPLIARCSPATLYLTLSTRQDIESWLTSRSALLAAGSTVAPDPSTAEAIIKPRLQLYAVLCELRAFRLWRGLYPDSLQALDGPVEGLDRFEYDASGTEANLVDNLLKGDSRKGVDPVAEWALD